MTLLEISKAKGKRLLKSCWPLVHFCFEVLINSYTQQSWTWKWDPLKDNYISFLRIKNSLLKWQSSIPMFKTHEIIGNLKKKWLKKECTLCKRVMIRSALNFWGWEWKSEHTHFFLMSESWAKLKKLMSVEHVESLFMNLLT